MCWQDGFGVGMPKTAEKQQTWPPHSPLIKTIPLLDKMASPREQIKFNLCCLWVSKCFHLFNFLLSGLLLQHWPKEKCVPHPQGLSFTVRSFPLPLIGSSSKIMRVFFSVSCYNLLPLGWPRYTAADSCRAWGSRRTRCWSSTLLSVRWWAIISAGLIIFCERLMYWPAKLSRWL